MVVDCERVVILLNKLSVLRGQIGNILLQKWERFEDVYHVIIDYVIILHKIPLQRSDIDVHLGLLKDLQTTLDSEFIKAKDNDYRLQFSFVYALRKKAMMIQELHHHMQISMVPLEVKQSPDRQIDTMEESVGI